MVSNELYLQGGKTISNESYFKGEKWYQINYTLRWKKYYNKKNIFVVITFNLNL
jgi:hypothetical protein